MYSSRATAIDKGLHTQYFIGIAVHSNGAHERIARIWHLQVPPPWYNYNTWFVQFPSTN